MAWASPRLEAFHDRVRVEGVPWIAERTVPIYQVSASGILVARGTGVLLRIADVGFVVSAAHVLKREPDMRLVVSVGEPSEAIWLNQMEARLTIERDHMDFGFVRLTDDAHTILSRLRKFVRMSELALETKDPPAGWYATLGYPTQLTETDLTRPQVTSNALYYCSYLHDEKLESFRDGASIAISFGPDNIDHEGELATTPHPAGISGCGIWRMRAPMDAPSSWNTDEIRLAGIEHTLVTRKALKGVRIHHVAAGIAHQYPDLRRSIELSFAQEPW